MRRARRERMACDGRRRRWSTECPHASAAASTPASQREGATTWRQGRAQAGPAAQLMRPRTVGCTMHSNQRTGATMKTHCQILAASALAVALACSTAPDGYVYNPVYGYVPVAYDDAYYDTAM